MVRLPLDFLRIALPLLMRARGHQGFGRTRSRSEWLATTRLRSFPANVVEIVAVKAL